MPPGFERNLQESVNRRLEGVGAPLAKRTRRRRFHPSKSTPAENTSRNLKDHCVPLTFIFNPGGGVACTFIVAALGGTGNGPYVLLSD